jgi:hypothetical protein
MSERLCHISRAPWIYDLGFLSKRSPLNSGLGWLLELSRDHKESSIAGPGSGWLHGIVQESICYRIMKRVGIWDCCASTQCTDCSECA